MYLIQIKDNVFIDASKIVTIFKDREGDWNVGTVAGRDHCIHKEYVELAINHLNAFNQNVTIIKDGK